MCSAAQKVSFSSELEEPLINSAPHLHASAQIWAPSFYPCFLCILRLEARSKANIQIFSSTFYRAARRELPAFPENPSGTSPLSSDKGRR